MSRPFARNAGDPRPGEPTDPSADTAVLPAAESAPTASAPAAPAPSGEDAARPSRETVPAAEAPARPTFRHRSRARRRARYLRKRHEAGLRDLGGLVLDLHRFGRERGDLVEAKVADLSRTHDELRALDAVLRSDGPGFDLREPGLGGTCSSCGELHGSADAFCARCGQPLAEASP